MHMGAHPSTISQPSTSGAIRIGWGHVGTQSPFSNKRCFWRAVRHDCEHLHPLLDHTRDSQLFFQAAELLARAQVPPTIKEAIRLGRFTAHIVRRLVARTISQQLSERVQAATAPFQYALSTRAGCECVAHNLHGITEMSATATITSVDGISAFDLISHRAMLEGLRGVDESVVPFVSMFYSSPSGYLWEDAEGTTHTQLCKGREENRETR